MSGTAPSGPFLVEKGDVTSVTRTTRDVTVTTRPLSGVAGPEGRVPVPVVYVVKVLITVQTTRPRGHEFKHFKFTKRVYESKENPLSLL